MGILSDTLRTSAEDVAVIGDDAAAFAALSRDGLLGAQDRVTGLRGCVDRYAALVAGEIVHRSRPETGHAGLAQSAGFVSPEAMISSVGKVSRRETVKLVQVGALIAETEAATTLAEAAAAAAAAAASAADGADGADGADSDATATALATAAFGSVAPPWQAPLVAALTVGVLSIDCVESIRRALGDIDPAVTAEQLTGACEDLIASAGGLTPEQLYRRARQVRDGLDEGGIVRREKHRRTLRTVRSWWDASGMYCGSWRLPPEEGMIAASTFERILSPRRGGPRMVSPDATATAEELLTDPRSTEQVAADAFVDLIRLAVDADPGTMFGRHRPAVRVIVTDAHLHDRAGYGRIEGHPTRCPFPPWNGCSVTPGGIAVGFDDDGQCVNVGRNQRLYTERQRVGMTVRDGGCRFPGCDRPPSYCEAHHIDQWQKDHGNTNIADGVLLCRRHHLLLHNNHWQVLRDRGDYSLKPPRTVDAGQELIPMPSHNPDVHALRRPRAG